MILFLFLDYILVSTSPVSNFFCILNISFFSRVHLSNCLFLLSTSKNDRRSPWFSKKLICFCSGFLEKMLGQIFRCNSSVLFHQIWFFEHKQTKYAVRKTVHRQIEQVYWLIWTLNFVECLKIKIWKKRDFKISKLQLTKLEPQCLWCCCHISIQRRDKEVLEEFSK